MYSKENKNLISSISIKIFITFYVLLVKPLNQASYIAVTDVSV